MLQARDLAVLQCNGDHIISGLNGFTVGLSDSGNFSITIVRTPLFPIVNSITIVDFVQVYRFIDS